MSKDRKENIRNPDIVHPRVLFQKNIQKNPKNFAVSYIFTVLYVCTCSNCIIFFVIFFRSSALSVDTPPPHHRMSPLRAFSRKAVFLILLSCLSLTCSLSIPRRHVHPSTRDIVVKKSSLTSLKMSDISDVPRGGDVGEGTATIPNEVFNLVKSIVGSGVLSLPAGNEIAISLRLL